MEPSFPRLETDHLTLRLGEEGDVTKILSYFIDNQQRFAPTSPRPAKEALTLPYWLARVTQSQDEFCADQSVRLFIFDKSEKSILGTASFTQITRHALQACYLGYGIDAGSEGKGLMFEALTRACSYVFQEMNLHRIMANHLPENIRSQNLLKRLGFQQEGVAKSYLLLDGKWQDHVLNSLINQNWISAEN